MPCVLVGLIEGSVVPRDRPAIRAGRAIRLGGPLGHVFPGGSRHFLQSLPGPRQPTVVTDATQSLRNQVTDKAPDKVFPRQRLLIATTTVLVVLPGKRHRPLLAVQLQNPLVAHRDPAGVARQIAHDRAGIAQGGFAVDVPAPGGQHLSPTPSLLHAPGTLGPDDLPAAIQLLEMPQKDRTEYFHHGPHRKEIVGTRLLPATALQVDPSATDQAVKMGMPVQGASPGMKHAEEAAFTSPVLALEVFEGLGGRVEEQLRGDAVVVFEELPDLPGQGKDDMKVRAVREAFADLPGPLGLPRSEAGRTMAVATGTGIPFAVMAVRTLGVVVAQGPVTAVRHQVELGVLLLVQSPGPEIAPLTQNCVDRRLDTVTLNMYQMTVQTLN